MKLKLLILLLLLSIAPMCLAYWIVPGYNQQHEEVAIPLCFLLTFSFSFTSLRTRHICVTVFVGMMVAKIIKIVIDVQNNPTDHNLFPFELAIDGVIFFLFILLGAGAARLFKFIKFMMKKIRKEKFYN